jgi:Ca2+-binding EF-hand superfamily protein
LNLLRIIKKEFKSKMSNSDDENQDEGTLTKEEEEKCWEAFSAFDKDSSGYIDANELRIVLEMMGQKTTEEEIFRMIAEADSENTGKITYA